MKTAFFRVPANLYIPVVMAILFLFLPCPAFVAEAPVDAVKGMVASAHPLASKVGIEVLKKGGNAVDAAVAAAFCAGVVEPYASGLGGGGFMLIYLSKQNRTIAIDYRETAPSGSAQWGRSAYDGHRSACVPGTAAGLSLALRKYGTIKLRDAVEPAARIAHEGVHVDYLLNGTMRWHAKKIALSRASRQTFLKDGGPYEEGELFRQEELAKTLRLIGEKGPEVFYRGEIAAALVKEMEGTGGWITKKDLEQYQALEKEPVKGTYRGYGIISAPPPASGLLIVELLNILEGFDMSAARHNSALAIQLSAEAMRRVFVDRARFMGDPNFVKVPAKGLLSKQYAAELRKTIHEGKAAKRISRIDVSTDESNSTTHISVIDSQGNAVALTQSLGEFFGSGITIPGTGIMLNNHVQDFAIEGTRPNSVAPGKRAVSAMAPTIVMKDNRPYLVVGGAGAMRVVSSLAQIIMNMIDHGMDVNEAIRAPRAHAQSLTLSVESRIGTEVRKTLQQMGYRIEVRRPYDFFFGGAQGVAIDRETGKLLGSADPRRKGAVAGY